MCRKFLEMGFTRARRYVNHKDGNKYDSNGKVKYKKKIGQQVKKQSLRRFKEFRDLVTQDEFYINMRKQWRQNENLSLDLMIL